jgi:hypothetical protein
VTDCAGVADQSERSRASGASWQLTYAGCGRRDGLYLTIQSADRGAALDFLAAARSLKPAG